MTFPKVASSDLAQVDVPAQSVNSGAGSDWVRSLLVTMYLKHYAATSRAIGGKYTGEYHRAGLLRRTETILGKPIHEATVTDVEHWWEVLQETNSPTSQAASLAGIRSFYRWAMHNDFLDSDPTRRIPAPRLPKRRPAPIAEGDLARAIASAEPTRIRPILVLGAFSGLRAHEIAAVHRRDIHGSTLTVIGKGDRERSVDLHPFVLTTLDAMPQTTWLFPRRDAKPGHLSSTTVSTIANEHLHNLGIASTLHKLRHRFATQLYLATHDLLLVQNLLGHASPTTTQVYTDFDRAASAAAVSDLPVPRVS